MPITITSAEINPILDFNRPLSPNTPADQEMMMMMMSMTKIWTKQMAFLPIFLLTLTLA